jgi:hypothetical protein
MGRFVLTSKTYKNSYKSDLVLEIHQASNATNTLLKRFALPYSGKTAYEVKIKVVLQVAERLGMLYNADKKNSRFPATFDGSAREFANLMFDRNHDIGELVLDHSTDGMILAMAFMLAGRCNTITKANAVIGGLVNLEKEVVLYFFTLMAYGNRQKAGKAALYALLTTKN